MILSRPRHERLRGLVGFRKECPIYTDERVPQPRIIAPLDCMQAYAPQFPRPCRISVFLFGKTMINTGNSRPTRRTRWDTRDMNMQALSRTNMTSPVVMPSFQDAVPLILSFAPNQPLRTLMFRIVGTAMVLSASGMWLMPGSQNTADLVLIKLGVSVFFFLLGLALLMRNHSDNQPDAYFDPIRSELRVLQKNSRGRPQTVLRRRYSLTTQF